MNEPEIKTNTKAPFKKRAEIFIDKYTPKFIKNICNKILDILPKKTADWIRNHRFLTVCIVYTIRGLFFRPSMWVLYAAIWAYLGK